MKLTRLVIHKYRNVAPGTTLEFNPGKNILLGKNATGKSTLLNLLSAVTRSEFSEFKGEEFSLDYETSTSDWKLHLSVRNERKEPLQSVPSHLGESAAGVLLQNAAVHQFTWNLRFTTPDPLVTLQVDAGSSTARATLKTVTDSYSNTVDEQASADKNVLTSGLVAAFRVFGSSHTTLFQALIQALGHHGWSPIRFDESLGFFERMLSGSETILRNRSHKEYIVGVNGISMTMRISIAEAASAVADSTPTTIAFTEDQQPFLKAVIEQLGFSAGIFRVERIEKRLDEATEYLRFGNASFDFTREDGSAINQSFLSFGQKRLLAFYYYLDAYPRVAIVDELVNGLHHHWIDTCLDALGERQAFLTSQNPLLLDHLSFESVEQVRRSFILCKIEKHDKHEQMVWSNMSEEDAGRFFTAYQAGIQHVSEILRTKGLW